MLVGLPEIVAKTNSVGGLRNDDDDVDSNDGATRPIIVANRAWIMTRRGPRTINLGETTCPTDNGSRWA